MQFCFDMYDLKINNGRFFANERPSTATFWSLPFVLEMLLREDVDLVEVDVCDLGMKSSDADCEGDVRERTKISTNSDDVAKRVARKCARDHRHVNFIGREPSSTPVFSVRRFAMALLRRNDYMLCE